MTRCPWAGSDPLYLAYHDKEWGVPLRDDRLLFEFLILEGAQAGLSWITILRKRERYRQLFAGFEPGEVARFTPERINLLLDDPGIVRNRLKVEAAVANARALLELRQATGATFSSHLWSFVDGRPVVNHWRKMAEIPAQTPVSEAMSRDLKKRGFKFVGPTICYALMQAVGLVNDHLIDCFRHREIVDWG